MAAADEIALSLLQQEGLGCIWELHVHAARVYREGDRVAAESLVQIADAAEEIWWRHILEASRSQ